MHAQRGQYTEAAYHFWQAEEYEAAVNIWYPHQDEEIERGHSSQAYEIFRHISSEKLKGQTRKQIKIIQNRLYLLMGEAERVLEGMEQFNWHLDEEITAEALIQEGQAQAILGRSEAALTKFDEAIEILTRLAVKIAYTHYQRGQLFLREVDFEAARREVVLAQTDVAFMQGQIEQLSRNFQLARTQYLQALESAHIGRDERRVARIHQFLTQVAARQNQPELAREHGTAAMSYFHKIGDRFNQEVIRVQMAGAYFSAREFDKYIPLAETALPFFEKIKHERWISALCNNLAEAFFETGHVDKAKEYVFRVLRMEVPRSLPYAHYTLALIYEKENQWEHCETAIRQGIEIAKQNEDKFVEAYLQRQLGNFYINRGDLDQGQRPLQTALQLFDHMELDKEAGVTREILERYG